MIRCGAIQRLIWFLFVILAVGCGNRPEDHPAKYLLTLAGNNGEFGEVYAIAERGGDLFVSDGDAGKIYIIRKTGEI